MTGTALLLPEETPHTNHTKRGQMRSATALLSLLLFATVRCSSSCSKTFEGGTCNWGWCDSSLNADCVWGTCTCRGSDCAVDGACVAPTVAPTFLGQSKSPTGTPTTGTPTAAPTTGTPTTGTPTAAPTTGVSLEWLEPAAKSVSEYLLDNYLTESTLCSGSILTQPCAVQQLRNATCTADLKQAALAMSTVGSQLHLSLTGFSLSCDLKVQISGTVSAAPDIKLSDFMLTNVKAADVSFSWTLQPEFTHGFPSGAFSTTESPACFTGSVTIATDAGLFSVNGLEAAAVNAFLPLELPRVICETLPQSLIDQKLNSSLQTTSTEVAATSVAVLPTTLPAGIHSWADDPMVSTLKVLIESSFLGDTLDGYFTKPLLLPINYSVGSLLSVKSLGIQISNHSNTLNFSAVPSHPQMLQLQAKLHSVNVSVLGTLFGMELNAWLQLQEVEVEMQAIIAVNESSLLNLQLYNQTFNFASCWPDAITQLELSTLNTSFDPNTVQLGGALETNSEFGDQIRQFVFEPIVAVLGGAAQSQAILGSLLQGPARAQINQELYSWREQLPECYDSCTFTNQTACNTILNGTECRYA